MRSWALEKKNATSIIRKSGFQPTPGASGGVAPVLSLYGSKRVCFSPDGPVFAGYPVNWAVSSGELYVWGYNDHNVMGLQDENMVNWFDTPTRVAHGIADVEHIGFNSLASAIVRSDGSVWTTGEPDSGYPNDHVFKELSGLPEIVSASANGIGAVGALYFLAADGTVWGMGGDMPGMGLSPNHYTTAWHWTDDVTVPSEMPTSKVSDVTQMAANGSNVTSGICFLEETGAVGRWNQGDEFPIYPTGQPVESVVKLAASGANMLILTNVGDVYVSGANTQGQHGNGTTGVVAGYPDWQKADGTDYEDVAGSGTQCFAVKDGDLYSWGQGGSPSGRGIGAANASTPTLITSDVSDFVAVRGSQANPTPMAVTDGGCVYIWGFQDFGQLGQGYTMEPTEIGEPVPLLISRPFPEWPVV